MENETNEMINRRFGNLLVLSPIKQKKVIKWLCKCDCGAETVVTKGNLLNNHTRSCGCLRSIYIYTEHKRICVAGTNLEKIQSNSAYKNSRTGHRGVNFRKDVQKYAASIRLRGKLYHLGCYVRIEDAIIARKKAEEKYYKPIVDLYKNQKTTVE